jgi:hypothetical protein
VVGYYDSSVVLSGILQQSPPATLKPTWDSATIRVSSSLLRIECLVGVRRAGSVAGHGPDSAWVIERIAALDEYLEEVSCKHVDDDIEAIVRRTRALSECRALDAIHIATALYLGPYYDEPLTVVTLDRRMRALAQRLGLRVAPEAA